MGKLVVRVSDSRPEGLISTPDATRYPTSTYDPCLNCGVGDRWCHHLSSLREFLRANSQCHLFGAQGQGQHLAPRQDEFRGPRSDYVRQVALETMKQLWKFKASNFDIEDEPRFGYPFEVDCDQLKQINDQEQKYLNMSYSIRA
ncbi:hypothetical protein TNCV_4331661 [Trichonephila clavipes]|nr:hypothetical protein TNCV_4331661 [Trichonephila clavipes]